MIIFFIFLFLSFFPRPVFAADLNIVCDASSCSISGLDPLFSLTQDGHWYPNRYLTKTINVSNSGPDTQTMSLQAVRSFLSLIIPSPLEDDDIINISLVDSSASLVWSGDLADFYSAGEIDFGVFPPGTNADYSLTISMNISADNNYQNKKAKLDLTLGFTTDTPPSPPANDGGDDGDPGDVSSSVCNDPIPATPAGLTAIATLGSVDLNWNHVSPPFTSYLIAYGFDGDTFLYGNPNIGSVNSYTVTGLTPGAQYCFYVRAQNGCMPGLRSEIACINSGSATLIVETSPPPGFEPDILGETTDEETGDMVDLPDIRGDSDVACENYYIPLLYILALFINSLYFFRNPKGNIILPVLVSLIAGLVDWFILRKTCCLLPSIFCRFFYIGNILSLFLPYFLLQKRKKQSKL